MKESPRIDDLHLFCTVARLRSFAAGARELGVSRAVVSKRIALLEATLGASLLHRTTRSVALTAQGESALLWAQRILDDADQLADAVSETRASARGLLRICTSSGFGRNRIAPALSALAKHHPGLEIQLELLDRPVDLIDEGFHLDIRFGEAHEPYLISRRLAANERVLCAAPAYLAAHGTPATLAGLTRHRCIVIRERYQDFGRWTLHGPRGEETVKVGGPLSASNGEIVHQWAIDGHGIILRSIWDVGASLERGDLVRVLPEYAQRVDVWAVYPSRLSSSGRLRICVEFLAAHLAA
ncbi:MAG: LysR family transcriptional regulator [Azospira sp.]|jgi:LysR family transcriptional activator of dmlA|nr:LysR family transcriptional regulator [Azospira sp.]